MWQYEELKINELKQQQQKKNKWKNKREGMNTDTNKQKKLFIP